MRPLKNKLAENMLVSVVACAALCPFTVSADALLFSTFPAIDGADPVACHGVGGCADEIATALNSLPVDFKTVIILCDVEGFT